MLALGDFWLETRVIIKILTLPCLPRYLTDFHGDEVKKKIKTNFKIPKFNYIHRSYRLIDDLHQTDKWLTQSRYTYKYLIKKAHLYICTFVPDVVCMRAVLCFKIPYIKIVFKICHNQFILSIHHLHGSNHSKKLPLVFCRISHVIWYKMKTQSICIY